jgi:hypothetical protein
MNHEYQEMQEGTLRELILGRGASSRHLRSGQYEKEGKEKCKTWLNALGDDQLRALHAGLARASDLTANKYAPPTYGNLLEFEIISPGSAGVRSRWASEDISPSLLEASDENLWRRRETYDMSNERNDSKDSVGRVSQKHSLAHFHEANMNNGYTASAQGISAKPDPKGSNYSDGRYESMTLSPSLPPLAFARMTKEAAHDPVRNSR